MLQKPEEMKEAWKDLAALIEGLPAEKQERYLIAIRTMVHDLRQSMGIISSAEALLRHSMGEAPENLELLDSIHKANQRADGLVTDFARPFERGIASTLSRLRTGP
jgi:signal transduction histidine kinase